MNWAQEKAKELVEKHKDKEQIVIASGVSPSGFIHIGNFREIVTTYFVGKELEKMGKKVRFILSFDDFDRFRKVPKNMPSEYEKYIGMPYTSIPSPFTEGKSYAQEMEDIFVGELNRLGIHPEIISQTKQYKSGRYNDKIKLAMDKRKEIFDILSKYKTQDFTNEDRDNYYPISLYCEHCGKDSTQIMDYDEESGKVEYKCSCGFSNVQDLNKCGNIKLQWKIDWPMRWQQEGVLFEPGGKDHSSLNGSFNVAKEISRKIFNNNPPDYIAYEFIGIKGNNGKMASSTGNILTLSDLLEVYDKNIILWFYAKNQPNHNFNIALDEDVIRYYSEFDRMIKSYFENKLDEKRGSIISLTGVNEDYLKNPDFGIISNFLPMVNYNVDALKMLLSKDNIDCDSLYYKARLLRAKNWLDKYNNSKIRLLDDFNKEYYDSLTDKEKEWIDKTYALLQKEYKDTKELQEELYSVVKDGNDDDLKNKQRRYFQIIYNMTIGQNNGPKLGLLLFALDKEKIDTLINKCKDNSKIKQLAKRQ